MFDVITPLTEILAELPKTVRLVAVSKYHPAEYIEAAYNAGQRIFGESLVQELVKKQEQLPKDIEWHFIGHLQTNKVKYIAPFVSMIHAVDSFKLLKEINRQGEKCGRRIKCLLQLHIAREETKFGFSYTELEEMLVDGEWKNLPYVEICGIMCMASNVDDAEVIRKEFHGAHLFFYKIQDEFFRDNREFCECSYGMSHDYHIAIEEGSTLVRVGSKIFGPRVY
jgi:pyridoxal phosphate enzyme (YggS family)